MKTKIVIILIILIFVTVLYAADVKWTALAELTTIADDDVLCVIDTGASASKKITVLNFFDTIDTSAELLAIMTNETGTGALCFATSPTFTTQITSPTVIVNLIDTTGAADMDYGSVDVTDHTFITDSTGDAEFVVPNDSIGNAELDWGSMTDLTTDGAISSNAVQGTDISLASEAAGDIMYHNGTDWVRLTKGTAGQVLELSADANVPEWDTDDSGGSTAWDDIGNPDNSGLTTITFDNAELSLLTGDNDAAASFFTIQNSDADHTGGNLYLLDLDYSADDGDVDADFIKFQDSGSVVMTIQQNGDIATDGGLTAGGTVEGATLTEGGVAVYNSGETPGGELGGTWASPTIDDSVSVSSWSITSPTFLTGITATDLIDSAHYVADSIDNEHINWVDIDNLGNEGLITVADTADATSFVALWESATGDLAAKSDGALLYAADTGTLAATQFSGGGGSLTGVDAATGDSATAFFDAGTIEHEYGGLEADINVYDGLVGIKAGSTIDVNSSAEMLAAIDDETGTGALVFGTSPTFTTSIVMGGADMSETDLEKLDGITNGTAAANKALVLGASGEIATITTATITTLTATNNIKTTPRHMIFTIIDPLATQTEDNEICLWPVTPAALTVTKIVVTLDSAANEVAGDLKWADAFIGLAGATVINVFDTSSGVLSDDSITSGNVAAGKCMYIAFDSAPNTAIHQMCVDITWDFD